MAPSDAEELVAADPFRAGQLVAGHPQDHVEKLRAQFFDRPSFGNDRTGVEIEVFLHALIRFIVAGDLDDRGQRVPRRVAASGGEGDDLRAAADHAGHDLAVMAFIVHEEESVLSGRGGRRVLKHVHDGRCAGFVHAAQGFFHHARDAAGEVAGRDQLVALPAQGRIQAALQKILDLVDGIPDLFRDFGRDGALHQHLFGAEQLVQFA